MRHLPLLLALLLGSTVQAATDFDCSRAVGEPFQPRFVRSWRALGGRNAGPLFDDLLERYAGDSRLYHTVSHVSDGLGHLDEYLAEHPEHVEHRDALVVAFWFHDAVYDSHRSEGNERASADLFLRHARGFSAKNKRLIERLVLVTETHEARSELERVFTDIDLSILGSSPSRFALFERQIRQEYLWVPKETYVKKRAEVLARFAARRPLYQTEFFRRRFENQAHRNLAAATLEAVPK